MYGNENTVKINHDEIRAQLAKILFIMQIICL